VPGEGNTLIDRLKLDGQSLSLQRIAKGEKDILSCQNIGVTEPTNEAAVFNP
jgi:hypothetical protein